MRLGCVEFAVPGGTLEEKLGVLEPRRMWLELANDGKKRLEDILGVLPNFDVSVKSVQAYRQHELQLLSSKARDRDLAIRHVEETIRMASEIGAQNVVVIITYGEPEVEKPVEKCVELFKNFGRLGAELDVVVSVEALGADRTTFLPHVSDVYSLVKKIDSGYVRPMIDTMHVHASGEIPAEVIKRYASEISEVQLRDTDSLPPGQGIIDFAPVLRIIREKFRGLTCLEYKPSRNPREDFDSACQFVKDLISVAR